MRLRRLRVLLSAGCAAVWVGAAAPAAAQPAVLDGLVLDAAGTPVAGALVTLTAQSEPRARRTTTTGDAGEFRFVALQAGRYRLRAERLGHRAHEQTLELTAGAALRVEVRLAFAVVEVEGVVARAERDRQRERDRFEREAGVTARVVEADEVRLLPGLAEPDVLRAIEVLPGVISTSDFSSAFNVRGGSADQNLILLDGFPIFNPFHLAGLFSVLNTDALARAELFAGGFGAEYGGRVSSVLAVESRRGGEPGWHTDAGVSLLATRVTLRGVAADDRANALGGAGGSWLLSLRRSYLDQLLRPVTAFPYHLTDVQTHAEAGLRGGGRLSFTGYWGEDVLDLSDFDPPGADSAAVLRIRWDWGNTVLGARWDQPIAGHWLAQTRLGLSRFATELGFVDFGDTRFSSRISQLTLGADVGGEPRPGWAVRSGVEVARLAYHNLIAGGGTVFATSDDDGVLGASYFQARWRGDPRWIVEAGLRGDAWFAASAQHATLSPRFAAKRFLGAERDWAVKLAVGRYTQFVHSLRDEELPFSIDTWVLADAHVPPVVSDQLQLGVETFRDDGWSASVEAYLRGFRGVSEFNLADDPNDPADDLLVGRGTSRGVDLQLRRASGRLTGWATVSLLRAARTMPEPLGSELLEEAVEVRFPPVWDRRVDFDLVLHYALTARTRAGLRWNYGSGLPYTRPVAQYFAWQHELSTGRVRPSRFGAVGDEPARFVVLGPRNAERYPPYHRLDLTLRHTLQRRWGTVTPYLQVLNAYNRRNPLFYFYNFDRSPPTRSGISMFPVLPAIGLEASF